MWTIPSSFFAADTSLCDHHHSLAAFTTLFEQYHHRSLLLLPPCVNNTIIALCCWYCSVWPSLLLADVTAPFDHHRSLLLLPLPVIVIAPCWCYCSMRPLSLSFFVIFITMSGSLQTSCCFNKHSTNLQMYIVWGSVFSILSDNWVHIIVWIVLNVVFGYKKHNLTLGTDNVNNLWSTIDDRWLLLTHGSK